jgi:hypothetical protein
MQVIPNASAIVVPILFVMVEAFGVYVKNKDSWLAHPKPGAKPTDNLNRGAS